MTWGAKYVAERATVTISGSGMLHLDDVQRTVEEAARLLREKRSNRLLLDCSGGSMDMKVVEVFHVPECYDRAGVPRRVRIAFVTPTLQGHTAVSGTYQFLETVCQNRGYLCRLFDRQEAAEQWLEAAGRTVLPARHIVM